MEEAFRMMVSAIGIGILPRLWRFALAKGDRTTMIADLTCSTSPAASFRWRRYQAIGGTFPFFPREYALFDVPRDSCQIVRIGENLSIGGYRR